MLASEIRERNMVKIDGKICQVIECNVTGTGKSGKTFHFKLKNVEDGNTLERRYRSEEKVERVEVERHAMEYLYRDGDNFVFMDQASYEQFSVPAKTVGSISDFIKENMKIDVLFNGEKPIHIDFPKALEVRVTSAPPSSGSGQDSTWKEVEIENGIKILAPQFIKSGDLVRMDVEHRKYLERIQKDK